MRSLLAQLRSTVLNTNFTNPKGIVHRVMNPALMAAGVKAHTIVKSSARLTVVHNATKAGASVPNPGSVVIFSVQEDALAQSNQIVW